MPTNTFKITCHDFQVKISNEKKKKEKKEREEELEFSLDQIVHKQTSKCPVSEQTLKRLATCRKSVPVKLCVSNNQLKLHFTERKKINKMFPNKKSPLHNTFFQHCLGESNKHTGIEQNKK